MLKKNPHCHEKLCFNGNSASYSLLENYLFIYIIDIFFFIRILTIGTINISNMYIPSEEMGDYEEARNRRKSSGPLYPLSEEGRYGPPPKEKPKPRPPLPGYEKRDRKSKVYASYAVSK